MSPLCDEERANERVMMCFRRRVFIHERFLASVVDGDAVHCSHDGQLRHSTRQQLQRPLHGQRSVTTYIYTCIMYYTCIYVHIIRRLYIAAVHVYSATCSATPIRGVPSARCSG